MVDAEHPTVFNLDPQDRLKLGLLGASVLILTILFADAIANLWERWGSQEELSHSYFIPLISGWLVWTNREKVKNSVGAPSAYGGVILFIAALMFLLGRVIESYLFQQVAMVVSIAGLTASFGGLSLLRVTAAPIGFLLFAVPPPHMLINILSWRFQEMSSILGVGMLQMFNVPVFLSGNIIDLGNYQLQVAEACSGLRYLFPFLSLGVMTAFIYRGPLWHKAIIVFSTIPITIFMNSFRIGVTGALVQAYGTEHAEGALHFFEGWVVFVLCLAALFGVICLLAYFAKPRMSGLEALGSPDLTAVPPSRTSFSPIMAGAAAIVISIGAFVASQSVGSDNLIAPERKSFVSLPAEFPAWQSEVKKIDTQVMEVLGADDTIVFDLHNDEGQLVNLYLAYLKARTDGRSWHSPQQCIPGGGWAITKHTVEQFASVSGVEVNYNRLVIQNRNVRFLVYYWYPQRGRHMANELVMRMWLTVDAVTKRRSDGAMIRLMTPITEAGAAAADQTLQDMINELDPILPQYVPAEIGGEPQDASRSTAS